MGMKVKLSVELEKNRENTMVLEFQEKGRHDVDARDRVGFQAEKKMAIRSERVCVCVNSKV